MSGSGWLKGSDRNMRLRGRRELHVEATWKRSSIFLLMKGNVLIPDGALHRSLARSVMDLLWPPSTAVISANVSGAQTISDALRS